MVPEEMYYEPELTSTITIPGRGKRKFENGEVRRITRKDIAQSARDLANSQQAQDYLSGNLSLGANRSRQRLFDREFKKERERLETERLLKEAGLRGDEVVVNRGFTPDEAMQIAHTFRSRPLTGHIGAGLGQDLGDKSLQKIASIGIGLPLLTANPVTGALIEPLAKPLVHTSKVLLDPTKAVTGIGEAAASTVDAYGAYDALKANSQLINNWVNGNFHYSDIPKFGLNALGSIPGIKYIADFIPAFGKAFTWAADDVARSYNNMVNEVEPALGIQGEIPGSEEWLRWMPTEERMGSASDVLPNPPSDLHIAPYPQQYSDLSRDVIRRLNEAGLGRFDIQNLLDRGFSYEDMLRLTDTVTPGVTSNRRAQVLEQRLRDIGITPTLPTRLNYLQSVIDNGGTLLEHRGVPRTFDEWSRLQETQDLDPSEHQWQGNLDWLRHTYYGQPSVTPRSIVEQSNPVQTPDENDALSTFESLDAFSDLRRKLRNSIEVFGEDEFKTVHPEIRRILIDGINSQKPVAQIESELDALYEQYDKPFAIDLSSIYTGSANAHIEYPSTYDIRKALIGGIRESPGNAPIRRNPYASVSDIPYIIKPGEQVYSPSSFSIFDASGNEVAALQKAAMARLPHGGITFDVHKSAQSMPMADRMYTRMIKDGSGVGTFLPSGFDWDVHYGDGDRRVSQYLPNDGYFYRKSNGLEGARWRPRNGAGDEYTPGINAPTARETLDENIGRFEEFLNVVDPRVFSEMGGYPKYGVEIDGRFYDLPITKGVRSDGTKGLVIQQSDDVIKAIDDFDKANESVLKTSDSWDDFKAKTQNLIERFHPDGADAKLTQNKKGIWGILSKDGKFVSLSSFAKNNPEFEFYYAPTVRELNDKLKGGHLTTDQHSAIMREGRFYMHGPVRAMRVRKHGGKIINNLNPTIKQLLNV